MTALPHAYFLPIFSLLFAFFHSLNCEASGVDLHAHLFMKEGMGWAFRGDFNGPLRADSWENHFSSQANPDSLESSQLDIVVATLYAHPLFTQSLRNSIRNQLKLARDFISLHPQWSIATTPEEATRAIKQKQKVIILALEGASGILESEDDLVEFVDKGGIRIVTLLHLTDDSLGGVAFLKGFEIFSTPLATLGSFFSPHYTSNIRVNDHGLSDYGGKVAQSLMNRKVWIDLSHASDRSQRDLSVLLRRWNQPHLYTHTVLRQYFEAERAITHDQLLQVAATHGFVGLMPSQKMLINTPIAVPCQKSLGQLLTQFKQVSQVIGSTFVGIGSDFNGGISHLEPACQTQSSLDTNGFWNIGQSGELWQIIRKEGLISEDLPNQPSQTAIQFIDSWSSLWKTVEKSNPREN